MRVHELAKELGVSSKELITKLQGVGIELTNHMAVASDDIASKARTLFGKKEVVDARAVEKNSLSKTPVKVAKLEKQIPLATEKKQTPVGNKPSIEFKEQKDQMIHSSKDAQVKSRQEVATTKTTGLSSSSLAHDENLLPDKAPVVQKKIEKVGAFVDEESSQEIFEVALADRKGLDKYTRIFTDGRSSGGRPFRRRRRSRNKNVEKNIETPAIITEVSITQPMHLFEAAEAMGKQASDLILSLLKKGKACNRNDILGVDILKQLAEGYGLTIKANNVALDEKLSVAKPKGITDGETRLPIVVVMGHVDHGKTTLLDYIRKKNIAATEKGGITQHLGAYEVASKHGKIVFLDTPGHEAFGYIRKQGSKITDLAVLVIAADDGIKPQTVEAIKHAQEAGVPIIVAINKIDKVKASTALETIKRQLVQYDLMTEDWGGQTVCVPISGKTGEGVEELLDMIILQSQMMDLRAHIARPAKAFVLESRIEKGYGPVATVICTEGTLKQGDFFICGEGTGKVRLLIDSHGTKVESVGPSVPVQVIGFNNFSSIGEWLQVVSAQEYNKARSSGVQQESTRSTTGLSVEKLTAVSTDTKKQVGRGINLIIKTDTRGSKEALTESIDKLVRANKEINCPIRILLSGIGDISESDIELAADTNAMIIGLHVKTEKNAQTLARDREVAVHIHQIIYHLIEFLQAEILKHKEVKSTWEKSGELVVRKVFDIKGIGVIAGCYVREGVIARVNKVACVRAGKVVAEGKISSLQRDKKSVKEVHAGFECGFVCDTFGEWQVDDTVYVYKEVKEA